MKNAGYEMKRAVLYDNSRGFALGENPAAPAPFVTWQFTEENGQRDYYWGRYFGTEGKAVESFLSRTNDYERENRVTLISEGPQPEVYKYYSTQRPVDLGTFPKLDTGPLAILNYEQRQLVENDTVWAWGSLTYAAPLTQKQMEDYELRPSRQNLDVRRRMDAQAQTVGKWEDSRRVPDGKRQTWYYTDFGSYVPKEFVTPEQLATLAERIEAHAHKAEKGQPPIADQLKRAEKQAALENKAPKQKKDAPDRGER